RQWDFVHCPPETRHVFVGAGEGPCVILAASSRQFQASGPWGYYTVDEAPRRYGACPDVETQEVELAYAKVQPSQPTRYRDGVLPPGHEREGAARRLFLRAVRDDEERHSPRVLVAPVSGGLVRPAPADDRADPGDCLRQPGGVLARRLAPRLAVVRPRPAEHPVVQPLATLAEPLA